nr:MAG TPA: hypothetical protein [Caudoviricetes sp.]
MSDCLCIYALQKEFSVQRPFQNYLFAHEKATPESCE